MLERGRSDNAAQAVAMDRTCISAPPAGVLSTEHRTPRAYDMNSMYSVHTPTS